LKPLAWQAASSIPLSRPIRARGLKLAMLGLIPSAGWSRPIRARGLKHAGAACRGNRHEVAPHTGAWIETSQTA